MTVYPFTNLPNYDTFSFPTNLKFITDGDEN